MAKMEVDDVVDLSLGSGRDPALTITPAPPPAALSNRDLRALTANNAGLTITPSASPATNNGTTSNSSNTNSNSSSSTTTTNNNNNNSSSNTNSSSANNNNNNNNNNSINASDGVTGATSGSIGGGQDENKVQRRVLRPRTEPKSYAEAPDIVLLPARTNGRQQNGNIDSETDDEEMPPYVPIKELSHAELKEREKSLRKLRQDLRNEETKLMLLKKLKQSQQVMKENLVVTPTSVSPNNPLSAIPAALTSKGSLSVTPTSAVPLPAHSKGSRSSLSGSGGPAVSIRCVYNLKQVPHVITNNMISNPIRSATNSRTGSSSSAAAAASAIAAAAMSGQHRSGSNSILPPPRSSLPAGATLAAGTTITPATSSSHRSSNLPPRTNLPNLTITPSVTITPTSAPPSSLKPRNVSYCNVIVAVSAEFFSHLLPKSTKDTVNSLYTKANKHFIQPNMYSKHLKNTKTHAYQYNTHLKLTY